MKFETISHRYIDGLFQIDSRSKELWLEFVEVLKSISDEEIIQSYECQHRKGKSISEAINKLIDRKLVAKGWNRQSPIFKDPAYTDRGRRASTWTLDFAKESIAIEVAFNHGGSVAWNLIKPVLSSELNHVEKAIQTKVGIIVAATMEMRDRGGFDPAIGTFEKYVEYLKPLNDLLVTPIMLVGLKAPESFYIEHIVVGNKKTGRIVRLNQP
jgi:hypothetical protein